MFARLFYIFLVLASMDSSFAQEHENLSSELKRLRDVWARGYSDIVSAEIEYLWFSRGSMLPEISDVEFLERAEAANLATLDGVEAFLRTLAPDVPERNKPFAESTLIIDGGKRMARHSGEHFTETISQQGSTEVRNWDIRSQSSRFSQANLGIRDSTPFRVASLADLLFLPRATMLFTDGEVSNPERNEDVIEISAAIERGDLTHSIKLSTASKTALVRRYDKQTSRLDGTVLRSSLIIQGPAIENTSQSVLPAWKLAAEFRQRQATRVRFAFITSAKINQQVEGNVFSVDVPADTVVVDARTNIDHPGLSRTGNDVDDVVAFADAVPADRLSTVATNPSIPQRNSRLFFILVVFVALAFFGLAYLLRRRART